MKKFIAEFKEFISRGNVMDLAVGMIIGSAFTAIVTSLVDDVLMPVISLFTGGIDFNDWGIHLAGGGMIKLGSFLAAVINFIIIALVIFLLIKGLNKIRDISDTIKGTEKKEAEPTTKICPYCKSEIDINATRCPHCTSVLEEDEKTA
ncbi:MAG: large conductance mechanosensitive channel protein MscL [Bilifractor sp.]